MPSIFLSAKNFEFNLDVVGRSLPESKDYWDANWLVCQTSCVQNGVLYKTERVLRNEDILRFTEQLDRLTPGNTHELAILNTGDGWLDIVVKKLDTDLYKATCRLSDEHDIPDEIEEELSLSDQDLQHLRTHAETIVKTYPVLFNEDK